MDVRLRANAEFFKNKRLPLFLVKNIILKKQISQLSNNYYYEL